MKNLNAKIDERELELVSKFLAPGYNQTPEMKGLEIESIVHLEINSKGGHSIETAGWVAWLGADGERIHVSVAAHFFTGVKGEMILKMMKALQPHL